jgi:benzylsuccinate CoA-transferase BbsF subunit
VADFSSWVVGPLITKTLADYGATVVLVESIKAPPNQRTTLPFKDNRSGINRSGMFAYSGANKYGMSLDLSNASGLDVARRLVAWADIVVENFSPGVMERLGLGYEELKRIRPDVIMLRASAQGQTGPGRSAKALGLQLSALAGFPHFTGFPDREPLSMMFAYPDYIVAFPALAVLVGAMDYRLRTGEGQLIDLSQYKTCLHFLSPYLMEYLANGKESTRDGNRSPGAAPHGVFRCLGEDSWVAIAVFKDQEWLSLCRIIGSPILSSERFATLIRRKANEDELDRLVGEWTARQSAQSVMTALQTSHVACGIVQKGEDVYRDPQLNARQFFWRLHHPQMGDFTHLGQPSVMSRTPARPRMPAPCIGEHTEFVCREFLGCSEPEFNNLLVSGAFGF